VPTLLILFAPNAALDDSTTFCSKVLSPVKELVPDVRFFTTTASNAKMLLKNWLLKQTGSNTSNVLDLDNESSNNFNNPINMFLEDGDILKLASNLNEYAKKLEEDESIELPFEFRDYSTRVEKLNNLINFVEEIGQLDVYQQLEAAHYSELDVVKFFEYLDNLQYNEIVPTVEQEFTIFRTLINMTTSEEGRQARLETIDKVLNSISSEYEEMSNTSKEKHLARFYDAQIAANTREGFPVDNILIEGPAGTGKTTMVKFIVEALKNQNLKHTEESVSSESNDVTTTENSLDSKEIVKSEESENC